MLYRNDDRNEIGYEPSNHKYQLKGGEGQDTVRITAFEEEFHVSTSDSHTTYTHIESGSVFEIENSIQNIIFDGLSGFDYSGPIDPVILLIPVIRLILLFPILLFLILLILMIRMTRMLVIRRLTVVTATTF